MRSDARSAMVEALTYADLKAGKGSERQQKAYQELEWRRCAADPAYFLSNYGWIKAKSGAIEKWTLWPIQERLLDDFMAQRSVIAVKARQLGVTTLTTHYFLWKVIFEDAAQCHLVSDSEDKAKEALTRVRITLDRLPEWMKERGRRGGKMGVFEVPDRKDKANSRKSISFGYSEFTIRTSTPNSVAGLTGVIALDEFSRHRDQEAVYDNVIPAVDGGGQLIIIANGQGEDEFYNLYQAAKRGENGLTPYFFWWGDDPSRDADWYERTKKKYLRNNPDKNIWSFRAQYPSNENEAFYISGDSRFDLTKLNAYNMLLAPMPKARIGYMERDGDKFSFRVSHRNGHLRLYEEPVEGATYVLGVDPAGGHAASDYSVIQVCRVYQNQDTSDLIKWFGYDNPPMIDGKVPFEFAGTNLVLEQVAVYQAKSEPTITALQAQRLGEWYNDALVVVEANQHGGTVIDRMKQEYVNLYREERKEKFSDEETERIGYWSSADSKIRATDWLAEFLESAWLLLRDPQTIKELSVYGYQVSPSGKSTLSAPKGMTDDLVSALSFAVVGGRSLLIVRSANPRKVFAPWCW